MVTKVKIFVKSQMGFFSHLYGIICEVLCTLNIYSFICQLHPGGSGGKESAINARGLGLVPDPLEKGLATHSSILAWRFHRQRSLAGYSPWVSKESDTTEQLTLSHITFR